MTLATRPPTTATRRRTGGDLLRGVGALLALAVMLGGVPVLLMVIAPVRLRVPAWDEVVGVLTRPDDGTLFLTALTLIAWAAWAILTVSVMTETVAQLRGLPAVRLPGLGGVQRLAGVLVAAVTVMLAPAASAVDLAHASPIVATAPAAPKPAAAEANSVGRRPVAATDRRPSDDDTKPRGPSVVVRSGDTLWALAERHLGDGARFAEIAALNYGRLQPDGARLVEDHWLSPGWVLLLPADATEVPPASASYTVQRGDTLSGIAAEQLEDAARYREVFTLNEGKPQPGGAVLADADVIRPGWRLDLPKPIADQPEPGTTGPAPDPGNGQGSAPAEVPSAVTSPTPTGNTAAADVPTPPSAVITSAVPSAAKAATGKPAPAPPAEPADAEDDSDEDDDLNPIGAFVAGLGGLAAAGILREVARRWRRVHQVRRPGQRLPAVSAEADRAGRLLRVNQEPVTLDVLQASLRALLRTCRETGRPLPRVGAVLLDPERIDLHLAEPYEPAPEGLSPFRAVGTRRWRLDDVPTAVTGEGVIDDGKATDPYPALVTVGTTGDALVMVNLEAAGTLAVTGDPESVLAALRALALELVTSPFTKNAEITLSSDLADLAAVIDAARAHTDPEPATTATYSEAHRTAITENWADNGATDLLDARVRGIAPDTWGPRIDLATTDDTTLPDGQPWTGQAVIRATSSRGATSGWVLDIDRDGTARLDPLGLLVTPQQLDPEHYRSVLDLLGPVEPVLSTPASPTPSAPTSPRPRPTKPLDVSEVVPDVAAAQTALANGWEPEPATPERQGGLASSLDNHRSEVVDTLPIFESLLAQPTLPEALGTANGELSTENPKRPKPTPRARPVPPAGQQTSNRTGEPPRLLLLGSVDVLGVNDAAAPGRRRRLIELVAFLALHPGATPAAVDEAMWPGARVVEDTRHALTTRGRRWLGKADDDREYLELFTTAKGYRLHPDITCDWHDFLALARKGLDAGPGGIEDLTAALALVRGRPFHGIDPRDYAWAEPDIQEMISTITDVAFALAELHRRSGHHQAAQAAAMSGLAAAPTHEALWDTAIEAARWRGDTHEEQRLTARRRAVCDIE